MSCATWQIRVGRGCGRSKTGLNRVWPLHDYALADLQGKHALCCTGCATTTGHNRVRDTIASGLAMADAGTVTEPLGLVPSALCQTGGYPDAGKLGGTGFWRVTWRLPRLMRAVLG